MTDEFSIKHRQAWFLVNGIANPLRVTENNSLATRLGFRTGT